jgi:hypothetical protein
MNVLVIASGSVTTTEPNLHVRQSCHKIKVYSPNVDWRIPFAQEVGQILLRLEATLSLQEVEARYFFHQLSNTTKAYTTLTDIPSPIRRFLNQAIAPTVCIGDPQSVNNVWT